MLRKVTLIFVTAAALVAGATTNAFAFSGGVSHVVTHPVAPDTSHRARWLPEPKWTGHFGEPVGSHFGGAMGGGHLAGPPHSSRSF